MNTCVKKRLSPERGFKRFVLFVNRDQDSLL
jgi:hypothetical protein